MTANLGAPRVSGLAHDLEKAGKQGDSLGCVPLAAGLRRAMDRLFAEAQALRETLGP
jgi:HPt (histidine-containing phosphotransfer) domain-containing protein